MDDLSLLVFAGKQVGLGCTSALLAAGCRPARLIAASAAETELLALAAAHGVPAEVYSAETQPRLIAAGQGYDWLLNLWSPHRLRAETLALARWRLNVHPSLIPHCRGNDNAAWTLRDGLPAGVSLIEMTDDLDAGGIWAQRPLPYALGTRGRDLHARLQAEAVDLFADTWPALARGELAPREQDPALVSYHTRRDTEADRRRDGADQFSGEAWLRWALAHDFAPGTTAELTVSGRRYRVTVDIEEL